MQLTPAILTNERETAAFMLHHPVVEESGRVHIDILDGSLHGVACLHKPADFSPLPTGEREIELHLMVQQPLPHVIAWRQAYKGNLRAIFQAETPRLTPQALSTTRDMRIHCSIGLAPGTDLRALTPFLPFTDEVLFLGVKPGASGQTFLGESILATIRRFHTLHPDIALALDGGATPALLPVFRDIGVDRVVASSLIWSHPDPLQHYQDLLYSLM